ncbi:uncharacterized protein LOC128712798 [Anopheles marshallii]|uniref:uncharacterized protein LOC128712798 n=1 Tax=Anopheles marshallii TaxID=1521116 RepID=UPI00237C4B6B|nr:uncharacterized protein LOC128712798 [Anopheles marshallii]
MKLYTVLFLISVLMVICAESATTAKKVETTTAPEPENSDSPSESDESPDVKTGDSSKDKPDMSPIEFMTEVIKSAMQRVTSGLKERVNVAPFSF